MAPTSSSTGMSLLWAKWGKDGSRVYPLVAHLIDTAAVAAALVDEWLPPTVLRHLAHLLSTNTESVRQLVVTGAATHDTGKCCDVFQTQRLSPRSAGKFESHANNLEAAGLPAWQEGFPSRDEERRWLRRHEVVGSVMLSGHLSDAGSTGIPALVAGHHGSWDIPENRGTFALSTQYFTWLRDNLEWRQVRRELLSTVQQVCAADTELSIPDPVTVPTLTGLVVLADWLASDLAERDLTPRTLGDWNAHHAHRRTQASQSISAYLGVPDRPAGDFLDHFGFEPNRPVQKATVREAPRGLRIITVPTGEGKTEAALGHWLLNATERQGLFFALPTMATADAIMTRIRDFMSGTDNIGALAHGQAILNEFYNLPYRQITDLPHDNGCDGAGALAPSRWLSTNHRAALAPVAVGTADQLLASVLRHRYNFLRMLGATTKTVVFDEVHSYDPYMARLLERFLQWAGELNIDVMLLSATLPSEQLKRFVESYGAHAADVSEYPAVTEILADDRSADRPQPATVTPVKASRLATRTLDLVHHVTDDQVASAVSLIQRLRHNHPDAKVGVIVNTIRRCQQVAREVQPMMVGTSGTLDVLHSRFPAAWRAKQTSQAVVRFGKASQSGPATLVATQVVEQSIDLDFDVLITDLAPAPDLIQRAGRLQRHDRTDSASRHRPEGLSTPTIHVIVPTVVDVEGGGVWDLLPYPPAVMRRTWSHALRSGDLTIVKVPGDVQDLVDRAHIAMEELASTMDEEVVEELGDRVAKFATAEEATVPTPESLRRDPARRLGEYAPPPPSQHFPTRWIDNASYDLLLVNGGRGTWQNPGPLPTQPRREQLRELLGCVVSVPFDPTSAPNLAEAQQEAPASWERTPLRDVHVVDVQASHFRLDPLLGLVKESQ